MVDYGPEHFNDPILQCMSCNKMFHREAAKKLGSCPHCGFRRAKTVDLMEEEDFKALVAGTYNLGIRNYKLDPKFLELFGPMKEVNSET